MIERLIAIENPDEQRDSLDALLRCCSPLQKLQVKTGLLTRYMYMKPVSLEKRKDFALSTLN